MENIQHFVDELDGSEHVIIHHNENEFTSMRKSTWDELEAQREQSGTL